MYTIINAFLRCLSFLLPPPWLQLGFCWWVGDECRKTAWPNPRARFKGTKPLTDQEVRTQNPSTSATSPVQSCVSLAASPVLPQGSPWGRIWEPWQAVERNFWIPFAIRQRWCQTRQVPNYPNPSFCKTSAGKSCAVAEKELGVIVCEEEGRNELGREAFVPGMSATMELPSSLESLTDSAGLTVTGMVMDRQVQEMGTQVTITVAIEAAEDEDPSEVLSPNHLDIHGGSCSEDDAGRHDKSSGAGTSGGELEEESWQPPDPDLTQKLVAQIEYYLSDENLEHDAFLLKHVRRNKMGFVSVKLLTSFKKVKHLTRDWRTTAYALRQSTLLELNEEGRKVRRRTLVPVFASESLPSRMLLLSELQHWPELGVAQRGGGGDAGTGQEGGDGGAGGNGGGAAQQEPLMEVLLRAFGAFGAISSVRVLKPGKELPSDLKKLSARYAQLGTEECAIVEFEEVEAAIKAHEAMGGETEDGAGAQGLKVVLIGTKPPKKKVPKDRQREEGGLRKSRSLNSRVRELQYLGDDSACSSSETESNPTSPRLARKARSTNKLSPTTGGGAAYQQNNHLSPGVSPRSSPWSSPRASPCSQRKSPHGHKSPLASEGRLSPESGRRWADYSSDSSLTPSGSPWVQRRRQVASQESSPVGSPMLGRKIQNADGLPPGVVRLPRGPDGTRGFQCASLGQRVAPATAQT
ncbi:la-related protein 6-like [Anguilla rostrata]|uniref:la-related protein 6-like n=1 Tax=Anguilla rostrata TaxID=7938 RepID=UPI0030D32B70